ncbi:MAG: hypothetical protein FVQ82_16980 [Planctomycetes bacterium]|nr:hypothetical protein [Planctomycetota bacterium]
MGGKKITSGVKNVNIPSWSEDYYKTPLSGSDWKSRISGDWKPFQPTQASTGWSIDKGVKQTPYSPMQGDVMRTMAERMRGEAYTPEGKQKIIGGAMAPIHEMAAQMKQGATEDAYARGLGQSGVLSRSKGEIDRSTMARMAEVTGDVERWATENAGKDAFAAIQAFQTGHASEQEVNLSIEKMRLENAQFNAELAQKHEELKAQINLDDRQMQIMLSQLEQAAYMTDVDREQFEMQIRNNYNLSKAQIELGKEVAIAEIQQANRDWWNDFIGNVIDAVGLFV